MRRTLVRLVYSTCTQIYKFLFCVVVVVVSVFTSFLLWAPKQNARSLKKKKISVVIHGKLDAREEQQQTSGVPIWSGTLSRDRHVTPTRGNTRPLQHDTPRALGPTAIFVSGRRSLVFVSRHVLSINQSGRSIDSWRIDYVNLIGLHAI